MIKQVYLLISIALLAMVGVGCGAVTPTPRPVTPTLSIALATLTPAVASTATATATVTATATISATATVSVTATVTKTTAPVTTRPAVTATARASATAPKPPEPRGSIAYHVNKGGVDRTMVVNLETNPFTVTPFLPIGPVMDFVKGTNAHWGDWSPDNSKFAYILTSGGNASQVLYVRKLGVEEPPRSLDASDSGGGLSSPSWSPAGDKIAYLQVSGDERVWKVKYAYYEATKDPGDRVQTIRADAPNEQYRGGLSWGKNGLLLFAVNSTGAADLYLLDQNGGGFGNLTKSPGDDSTPAWSPDGKLIAFTSSRDGNSQIYLMNADGTGVKRLSKNNFKEYSPSWSQDGNWIAFSSTRDGFPNIYIMDKNGGNAQRITPDGGDIPVWSH